MLEQGSAHSCRRAFIIKHSNFRFFRIFIVDSQCKILECPVRYSARSREIIRVEDRPPDENSAVVMEAVTATAAAPVEVSLPTSLTSSSLGSNNLSGESSLYYEDCSGSWNSSMAFAHSLSYALENSLRLWQVRAERERENCAPSTC